MDAEAAHRLAKEAAPVLLAHAQERLRAGDHRNAREMSLGALSAEFDHANAWSLLGTLAIGSDRYAAAIAIARRALALSPDSPWAMINLGNHLRRAQRFAEAEPVLRKGLAMAPESAGARHNLALLCYSTGRAAEAEALFLAALAIEPTQGLRADIGHAILKQGHLSRGLEAMESRWDGPLAKNPIWDCGLPRWAGEPTRSGTLLLHHEQGFGDTLQFVRFIPAIKARANAARVIFACPKPLQDLLKDQCGIDEIIDDNAPGPIVAAALRSDYHCPLQSALCALRPEYSDSRQGVLVQDLVGAARYLKSPHRSKLPARAGGAKLAVGLCWGASLTPDRGSQKSIPLEQLVELCALPGVRFWSLQFESGPHAEELQRTGADHVILPVPHGLGDFAQTAAIMERLDLIVSIDSSAAHLAGAIGRPVFMLNPYDPCWRWVHGAKPWYETMEIFAQPDPSDWRTPVAAIGARIAEMVAERVANTAGADAPKEAA